jgi:GAF domain-containing protein
MGFVLIASLLPDAYTDADESVLTAIASQVAIALDSVFLAEDVGRGARINSQIYELSENLSEADSEEEVFSAIADAAFGLLDLDGFAAMIYDGQQLRTHFMLGLAESIYDYAPAKGQGIPGWVIEFEAPATAQDIIIDPKNQSALWPSDDASLLCVPLQRGAKSIGVLVGVSQTPRQFTIADTELFYTLAHLAAGSLKCGD